MTVPRLHSKGDPTWYKDAVIYEVHVRAFHDSNGDGIGDFAGLTAKLDYLQDLGVTALWLLPFYPSPLKDDGYDISDYFNIHPQYGTLREFKKFIREAHRRRIRVITELVLNHTSDQNRWFRQARRARPGSSARDFYVWSDAPDKYREARIIFPDFESSNWSWDPLAQAYYWHRFFSHQPDLNFRHPRVVKEIFRAIDFWLKMGVDGLRLDAVPYLYEKEGTNCENLPETHAFLKKLRRHVKRKFGDRMLLAEANQWPEEAAAYFGRGDECQMAFHFPLMPRMFMALQMEDRFPLADILEQTPTIPEDCQWALFLRNHDELTLEMVTDKERDYMFRSYARDPRARINLGIRRRLAPLLNNYRRKIELLNILLFTLPGTPVIYYGDEIGMGDNYYLGDRNGVRTPMQWGPGLNAGFSRANPHQLYLPVIIDPEFHYQAVNVKNQQSNLSSLLWWMKRLIATRKKHQALSRGDLTLVPCDNPKIFAFTRRSAAETILIAANLSQFPQVGELDLSLSHGLIPEDVFSKNPFPVIKNKHYPLTFSPYAYFILSLRRESTGITVLDRQELPPLRVRGNWERILEDKYREELEKRLAGYLPECRWFGGKARNLLQVKIIEKIPLPFKKKVFYLLIIEVIYATGTREKYLLPLAFSPSRNHSRHNNSGPEKFITRLISSRGEGVLAESFYDQTFLEYLLFQSTRKKKIPGINGRLRFQPGKLLKTLTGETGPDLSPRLLTGEQSNTSITYGQSLYLKLYRRLEEGKNPEPEIIRFLTEKTGFSHISPFAGRLVYQGNKSGEITLGLFQGCVAHQEDAWSYSLEAVGRYYDLVLTRPDAIKGGRAKSRGGDYRVKELIGKMYLEMIDLLGRRTAGMHRALASDRDDPSFAPEPLRQLDLRSLSQTILSQLKRVRANLAQNQPRLSRTARRQAIRVLSDQAGIDRRLRRISRLQISGMKIRIHGDFHLGQVLYTGKDFTIIDFEGEPSRSLSERRLKRSPLRDIAGMLRSFHYAAYGAIFLRSSTRPQDIPRLRKWAELWYRQVSRVYLDSYLDNMKEAASLLPRNRAEFQTLLDSFILEKAVYELDYELNHRPGWLIIPLRGIQSLLSGKD